ncbi:site-2 protease family protein [Pleurocapsales cyanobacterium LEGE 10410]|nr:site-2 protease family protein [Pleurocapsales cyanobacterium LEGE 10410]
MNGNIRIGNLFGIPFLINPSWFFVLGLVTWSYGSDLARFPGFAGTTPWILGFITALLLFASVLAHELGHSFVAISQGIPVKSITLFIFGGLATLEKESETPLQAFLVAIAGPLVSILLFGVFFLIDNTFALNLPLKAIISPIAYINLVLAVFNMIPGLPLDGGNVLKSIVWKITGNPNKGVIFAGRVGQIIGWIAISLGILSVLGISRVGSIWTLLIGTFLLQNAGFAAQSATVQDKLSQYTARDAVIADSPIVNNNITVREFVNNHVIGKERWKKFLVVDEAQQLVGAITIDSLKQIPTSEWNEVYLNELVQPVPEADTIPADTSLLEAAKTFETKEARELVVVEAAKVLGLLEKSSIINLMSQEEAAKSKAVVKSTKDDDKVIVN